ncbi:O-fucosyltransferase 24-like isoform X2 [Aristolochia californica]
MPFNMDEKWIRANLMGKLNKVGILILRGFDSRLSKDLNPDLQKLRCKVAFHALKFRSWIEEIGEKLAKRMGKGGPYMALHLRLEKDVWVRTGCLPGLGDDTDLKIEMERKNHPELLTSRSNMTAQDRYIAGLCPLNAFEIFRLLKGLGASKRTRIYWAGGEPFGGDTALEPLVSHFPYMYNKWSLAGAGELDKLKQKPSILAAIDYIVCLKSHVFMANHGGNMARSLQGHRAYDGHRKHITPNKRQLVQLLMNKSLSEVEMEKEIKMIHVGSLGSPLLRTDKPGRDVIAFPVPECMCSQRDHLQSRSDSNSV